MMTIATHDGIFHSDEVLAIALLKYFREDSYDIIRSRDKGLIEEAGIAIDVGGVYDPHRYRFDHHQFNKDDINWGKSSAGLIWGWIDQESGKYPMIDELVSLVDANDTGVKHVNDMFHSIIRGLNDPADPYCEDQQINFELAVNFTVSLIETLQWQVCYLGLPNSTTRATQIALDNGDMGCDLCHCQPGNVWLTLKRNKRAAERLEKERAEAIASAKVEGDVITFSKEDPFVPVKELIGKAHVSVQWDDGQKCWSIQTIPLRDGSFESKYALKAVGDEIFIHPAGFISKTKSGQYSLEEN